MAQSQKNLQWTIYILQQATYSNFSLLGSKLWEEFGKKGIKCLALYKEYGLDVGGTLFWSKLDDVFMSTSHVVFWSTSKDVF